MKALELVDGWDVPHVAVAAMRADGVLASRGDPTRAYRLASIAKVLAAYAGLIAVEEHSISLDDPAGPPGASVRHLLSHAAGYGFDGPDPVAPVARKRSSPPSA
jgi:CubicO group peptidase (beta-lactamase class C family)